ncbi:rhomboid-like protein 15 isoform X2 [Rhodamnia argentea]|uniref:Rhomboid-like protein 15 isoform X2 n=1 Tax=Rhodamnia argentea TaxID=178133 RepID=A0ABM3HMA5_9MYRT|nr:rhomboid-like protein 15 isoform X2 [Rhodamnia argentea]
MRPNIVTEAGLPTRLGQWWEGIPFLTSAVVITCGTIYLICLLTGYDSFHEVCFLPSEVISRFQVYRIFTSIVFHGSLLHVFFNMLALVPLGSELERLMGSVRLLYIIVLLATSSAVFHLFIALLVAHNPFRRSPYLMNECSIGFSGILFSMIVIETSLSGIQSRSVFGLFNVPAKWYAWILLVAFQLLMSNVSLLGHLCGILSGFAYTYGLFNYLIPGTSFYSAIEASSLLSTCVRRPKFIMCTGGNTTGYIPTYLNQNATSSGLISGNLWRNLSAWMPQRETSVQSTQDGRFPGRGRTLGSERGIAPVGSGLPLLDGRNLENTLPVTLESHLHNQASVVSDEEVQKLVSMGFDRTQVEVAVAAADGDLDVAVEILMSQQG